MFFPFFSYFQTVVAVLTSKIALESENKSALVKDQQELNQQIAACANYMVNVDGKATYIK